MDCGVVGGAAAMVREAWARGPHNTHSAGAEFWPGFSAAAHPPALVFVAVQTRKEREVPPRVHWQHAPCATASSLAQSLLLSDAPSPDLTECHGDDGRRGSVGRPPARAGRWRGRADGRAGERKWTGSGGPGGRALWRAWTRPGGGCLGGCVRRKGGRGREGAHARGATPRSPPPPLLFSSTSLNLPPLFSPRSSTPGPSRRARTAASTTTSSPERYGARERANKDGDCPQRGPLSSSLHPAIHPTPSPSLSLSLRPTHAHDSLAAP